MNVRIKKKKYSKLDSYYKNIFIENGFIYDILNIKSYYFGIPVYYRDVYYFWFYGRTLSVTNRGGHLNQVIKIISHVSKMDIYYIIPVQLPYLIKK